MQSEARTIWENSSPRRREPPRGQGGSPLIFFIVWHGELRLLTARGSSQVAAEAEGDEAAKPLATTESGQWLGFRVKATYILDLEDEEAPRPVRHHSG